MNTRVLTGVGMALWAVVGLAAWAADAPPAVVGKPVERLANPDDDEAKLVRRMTNAGDPRVIPIALHWLAAEQDGQAINYGSARLRAGAYAAKMFRVKEARPLLLAAYFAPSASGDARSYMASAAISLDRDDLDFCRQVITDSPSINRSHDNPGMAAATAALAMAKDARGMEMFVKGYAAYLDGRMAGKDVNFSYHREMTYIDELAVRERVMGLLEKYPDEPARNQLLVDCETVRMNNKPEDERLKIALDEKRPESDRYLALNSLGFVGSPDALPALEKATPWAPVSKGSMRAPRRVPGGPATTPASGPTNPPASTHPAKPATKGAEPQGVEALNLPPVPAGEAPARAGGEAAEVAKSGEPVSGSTAWAIVTIKRRNRLGVSPETPPTLVGVVPPENKEEGTRIVRVSGLRTGPDGRWTDRPLLLRDGVEDSPEYGVGIPEALAKQFQAFHPDTLMRVRLDLDPNGKPSMLTSATIIRTLPGEATPRGYVLVSKSTDREGESDRLTVVLHRLGERVTARVPTRNKPGGGAGPDRMIAQALADLKPGAVVEARLAKVGNLMMVTEIAPYRPAIPATFVRWLTLPEGAEAVDVFLGTAKRTLILPEPREAVPVPVSAEMKERFWPGCKLRVRPEGGELIVASDPLKPKDAERAAELKKPARLRDFEVLGSVMQDVDAMHVKVATANGLLQGDLRTRPFVGTALVTGRSIEYAWMELGVRNVLAGKLALPGGLSDLARKNLEDAMKARGHNDRRQEAAEINKAFDRYRDAAEGSARRAAEQETLLRLQKIAGEVIAEQNRLNAVVRGVLSRQQFEALLAGGKPMPATRPTTRPAKAAPRVPATDVPE